VIPEVGELFDARTDVLIVTGNATLKANGAVVMGRGAAKELRDRVPGIDRSFGKHIARSSGPYGLVLLPQLTGPTLGLLQVKRNYWEPADPELIRNSLGILATVARASPERRFDLNYPGIGNGRLAREVIEPLLNVLPNNVHVWARG
jgi:hypothetical protein